MEACIGLEEASPWTEEDLATQSPEEVSSHRDDLDLTALGAKGRSVRALTCRIAHQLSVAYADRPRGQYWDERFWRPGCGLLQMNFYPLGKSSWDDWPDSYERLFGYGRSDRQRYEKHVEETRFLRIRANWERYKPQAVICFGKLAWNTASIIFDLNSCSATNSDTKIRAYPQRKVILTPFFSYRHFRNSDADVVAQELRNWGVALP